MSLRQGFMSLLSVLYTAEFGRFRIDRCLRFGRTSCRHKTLRANTSAGPPITSGEWALKGHMGRDNRLLTPRVGSGVLSIAAPAALQDPYHITRRSSITIRDAALTHASTSRGPDISIGTATTLLLALSNFRVV
jgi:hypothetical protein